MMSCYNKWHSHYVTEVWDPLHECPAGIAFVQPEMLRPSYAPIPSITAARRHTEEAWNRLNTAVSNGLMDASSVSIHRSWIEDIRDFLESDLVMDRHCVELQAGRLSNELYKHSLYPSEKNTCREIVEALHAWRRELKNLTVIELETYEEILFEARERADLLRAETSH